MLIPNDFRPWRFATSVNGDAARQDSWAGRIERCLAAHMTVKARYALNKVVGFSPCKWTARFREEEPRPLFPQVERGVELDEGHASLPRASALRARFPLPVRVNRGWRCVSFDAAVCARISVGGCRGFARGRVPAGSGRFRRKWAPISPWVLGFCAVFGGGCSLPASPTWGNVGVLWRFGPIRSAKPLRNLQFTGGVCGQQWDGRALQGVQVTLMTFRLAFMKRRHEAVAC